MQQNRESLGKLRSSFLDIWQVWASLVEILNMTSYWLSSSKFLFLQNLPKLWFFQFIFLLFLFMSPPPLFVIIVSTSYLLLLVPLLLYVLAIMILLILMLLTKMIVVHTYTISSICVSYLLLLLLIVFSPLLQLQFLWGNQVIKLVSVVYAVKYMKLHK